jgi:5'-nucleotidase
MPGVDPMGRKHYWFTVTPLEAAEEGTDRWAVENGYVSITPLRLDLTHEDQLKKAIQKQPTEGMAEMGLGTELADKVKK